MEESVYIDGAVLRRLETEYGVPRLLQISLAMAEREYALCKTVALRGRAHDVTLFIFRAADERAFASASRREGGGSQIAVIRKWSYPPGLFRPPSGGVEPEEPFEAGAVREAREETGLEVALERYLVRVCARFEWQEESLDWTTHVFSARWLGGEIGPVDTREIAEARWSTVTELNTDLRERMLARGSAGFRYRVALQDAAFVQLGMRSG
jgi:ADP-ribose pyrophosphatase YjhB (NUDIX family)